MPLEVSLVAADRSVWSGEAKQLSARTTDGDIGILPGHAPLLGVLVQGHVRVRPVDGSVVDAEIDGGFLSVDNDTVTVVAERVRVGEKGATSSAGSAN